MHLKRTIAALVALLALLLPTGALANSGPVHWEGYAHAETMAVNEDCPIEVQHEELLFDLTKGTDGWHTVRGTATATYTMHNPTNRAQTVQMAFPLISALRQFNPGAVSIRAGGVEIPHALHVGQPYATPASGAGDALPDYSFATILAALQQGAYAPAHFDLTQSATLYTIRASRTGAQDVTLTIRFPAAEGAYFLGERDIHGYGQDETGVHFVLSTAEQETTGEILVIGDAPAPEISGVLMDNQQPTNAYNTYMTTDTVQLGEEYLRPLLARMVQMRLPSGYLGNEQAMNALYSLCLRRIDEGMGRDFAVLNDTLEDLFDREYMLALQYTVEFPANAIVEVTVRYPVSSAMDRRNSKDPTYPFTYLFSPAEHWAAFGGLNITVRTPEEAAHILDSSLPFTANADGTYTAHAATLPSAPLTFTLYNNASLPAAAQAQPGRSAAQGKDLIFILAGALLLAGLIVSCVILFRKKGQQDDTP